MMKFEHTNKVSLLSMDKDDISAERKKFAESKKEETVMILNIITPSTVDGNLLIYGDTSIMEPTEEGDNKYIVNSTSLNPKVGIINTALELSLKETFAWMSKNKVKPTTIYVCDHQSDCANTSIKYIQLYTLLLKVMYECKIDASLVMEMVERENVTTLYSTEEKAEKKKKKKDKKKGKKK